MLYEAWKLPGGDEEVGTISATEAKPIGAQIIIASASRKFRIWHDERSFDNRGCWRLEERWAVGTKHPTDDWRMVSVDGNDGEYCSLREARAVARRMARS